MPSRQQTFGTVDVRFNPTKACDKMVFNDETGEYEKCGVTSNYAILNGNMITYRCKMHGKDSWEDIKHPDIVSKYP